MANNTIEVDVGSGSGGGGGSGTVTSVNVSGGTTGLTTSGGPVTTSGTITIAGKLAVANGGTNSSTALNNNRVIQSSGGAIVEAAAITAARALISDANGIPTQSVTTATELSYVNGVTSAIQTQLNAKGAGTVTSVSVTTANGVSGTVATATTTPAISLALGAITPTSVNASGTLAGSNFSGSSSGTNTGDQTITLTSDVTGSGTGSIVATIATGAVTDTKGSLANKPACTVVATSNQTLSGTPTIDGQATAVGSIILLTAQSTGAENGPWVAAAGAWSRPTWYPTGGTTQAFQFITTLIRLGTTYQGTTWRMTTAGAITIDTTATAWAVVPFAISSSTITGTVPTANLPTNALIDSIGITIDGSGSVITTGVKGDIFIPYAATINSVTMLADQTGSCVIDIWKVAYASYPATVSNTITASAVPTISSSNKSQDTTLTGWTTSISAGDCIRFNVNSASTITRVTLVLKVTHT